jgi:hypothetical protein
VQLEDEDAATAALSGHGSILHGIAAGHGLLEGGCVNGSVLGLVPGWAGGRTDGLPSRKRKHKADQIREGQIREDQSREDQSRKYAYHARPLTHPRMRSLIR